MTIPPFNLSEEMRVKMPLKILIAILGVVAAGAIVWASTQAVVADHALRIERLETNERSTHEVLIRIDERTAEIKRRLDASPR